MKCDRECRKVIHYLGARCYKRSDHCHSFCCCKVGAKPNLVLEHPKMLSHMDPMEDIRLLSTRRLRKVGFPAQLGRGSQAPQPASEGSAATLGRARLLSYQDCWLQQKSAMTSPSVWSEMPCGAPAWWAGHHPMVHVRSSVTRCGCRKLWWYQTKGD